ncbi:hypothetical protein KDW40_02250 [Burkholderia cenocepacia]|uniref:hypothetical protein n=1 Tax=Burkholderia cenocepacia TaxID=95486 RepID=UPI001B93004F|nr:hypothetical protein [Burkholderia cenocepacia]MBR8043387.1 hypothetical protein [Burkholderia cenocepacia]MBR8324552.1 hypothetical protein [Burkholderia cenocepacia]
MTLNKDTTSTADDFITHRAAWRKALVIARSTSPTDHAWTYWENLIRQFDREFDRYMPGTVPDSFIAVSPAWRQALEIARDHALISAPDMDDKAYWTHELSAFDQAFSAAPPEHRPDAPDVAVQLQLLREVVAAQIRLWDARRALEKATAPNGEYSDRADDESLEHVRLLAAGLDSAEDAFTHVTVQHLARERLIALN